MFAAQYFEHSKDVSNVKLNRIEKPSARPGMVVVRVVYAAVNPADTLIMSGTPGFNVALPHTPGFDFSGTVEEVTADDTKWKVGDRVFSSNWGDHTKHDPDNPMAGSFAQYLLLPGRKLSKIPETMSFEATGGLVMGAGTAYDMLTDHIQISAGQRILITGGSSAVGSAAVQIAKLRGAWVATTASTRNFDYVAQFKPDLIVDYTQQNWWEHPELKGLDAVLDCVGTSGTFAHVQENAVLKPDGAFLTVAFPCGYEVGFNPAGHPPLRFACFKGATLTPACQDSLASLVQAGSLVVPVHKVFPFTEEGVQAALRETQTGKSVGKNVIKIVA